MHSCCFSVGSEIKITNGLTSKSPLAFHMRKLDNNGVVQYLTGRQHAVVFPLVYHSENFYIMLKTVMKKGDYFHIAFSDMIETWSSSKNVLQSSNNTTLSP